jgi:hypothetical protein
MSMVVVGGGGGGDGGSVSLARRNQTAAVQLEAQLSSCDGGCGDNRLCACAQ